MDDSKPSHVAVVAAVLICVGAALLVPRLLGTPESGRKAEVAAAVKVIKHALWKYAQSHGGEYPEMGVVLGGDRKKFDVLLKEGYLVRYPPNPFSKSGSPMWNAREGGFSPGNFVYITKEDSKYDYTLFAWGAEEGRKVGMTGSEEK